MATRHKRTHKATATILALPGGSRDVSHTLGRGVRESLLPRKAYEILQEFFDNGNHSPKHAELVKLAQEIRQQVRGAERCTVDRVVAYFKKRRGNMSRTTPLLETRKTYSKKSSSRTLPTNEMAQVSPLLVPELDMKSEERPMELAHFPPGPAHPTSEDSRTAEKTMTLTEESLNDLALLICKALENPTLPDTEASTRPTTYQGAAKWVQDKMDSMTDFLEDCAAGRYEHLGLRLPPESLPSASAAGSEALADVD